MRGLQGKAKYFTDAAFETADEDVAGFGSHVRFTIENYLAIVHQAGTHAADLVNTLWYPDEEGGVLDGFTGYYILTETRRVLREILEEDEEMRAMIEGYYTTTAEEDAAAAAEAAKFNRDHAGDKDSDVHDSAKGFVDNRVSEKLIHDAAAGGDKATQDDHIQNALAMTPIKVEVRLYDDSAVRSDSDALPPPPVELQESASVSETIDVDEIVDPAVALFNERPQRIKIDAPNYSKSTPAKAFRSAMSWMVDHIVYVASGSKKQGSFPRLAPIIAPYLPAPYAVTVPELDKIVRDLRHHASQLRVPGEDDHGSIANIFAQIDPEDPAGSMQNIFEQLTGRRREDDPFDLNEDSSFREGDSEAWQDE